MSLPTAEAKEERYHMSTAPQTTLCLRRRIRRAALASAAVLLLVLGFAGPASAHDSARWLYYGGVLRGHGGVTASHHYVYACDDRADGNRIYTEFRYSTGSGRVYDSTATPGCTQMYVSRTITSYRVCMELSYRVDPCTTWTVA